MHTDLAEFAREVRSHAADGRLDKALRLIASLCRGVLSRDSGFGRVFSSPELDVLCQELGRATLGAPNPREGWDDEHAVFIVSGLYRAGGHTRVLRDLITADPGRRATVVVTGVSHEDDLDVVKAMIKVECEVELASQPDWGDRLRWLQGRLADLKPARVYIVPHPFDPVIYAAVQPELVDRLFYYHSCDHMLALGVHLPHADHIDFNAKGFFQCRHRLGVNENRIWPLTAAPPSREPDPDAAASGGLRTCCCGGMEKFETLQWLEGIPYSIDYSEVVVRRLATAPGEHVHIGFLSEAMRGRIAGGLAAAGVDPTRFEYHAFVPLLGDALHELRVNLYMGSMPRGGGRATVEAMSAGMPMLIHSNYRSVFLCTDLDEVYPGALAWRTLDELERHLAAVNPGMLADHGRRSRGHYDRHHRPEALRASLEKTLRREPFDPPPAPRNFPTNELQAYLDERESEAEQRRRAAAEAQAVADERGQVVAALTDANAALAGEATIAAQALQARSNELESSRRELEALAQELSGQAEALTLLQGQLAEARNYRARSAFEITGHLRTRDLAQIIAVRLLSKLRARAR